MNKKEKAKLGENYRKPPMKVNFWQLIGYVALIGMSTFLIGFCLGGWLA